MQGAGVLVYCGGKTEGLCNSGGFNLDGLVKTQGFGNTLYY